MNPINQPIICIPTIYVSGDIHCIPIIILILHLSVRDVLMMPNERGSKEAILF